MVGEGPKNQADTLLVRAVVSAGLDSALSVAVVVSVDKACLFGFGSGSDQFALISLLVAECLPDCKIKGVVANSLLILRRVHTQVSHQVNQFRIEVAVFGVGPELLLALEDPAGLLSDQNLASEFEFLVVEVVRFVGVAGLTLFLLIPG